MNYKFPITGNQSIDDLGNQFEKIIRVTNRGSIKTRYRYAAAGERFIKWVVPAFHMQKLANLSDKHLLAYAEYLKEKQDSDKYIKTELSALRFIHAITPNTRHVLGEAEKVNKEAGMGSTANEKAVEVDRAWTRRELDEMSQIAIDIGRPEFARMMNSTYNTGMRIDEAASLHRSEVERALRVDILHLTNTKGGRPRDIPLLFEARSVLSAAIVNVPRGGYVFCPVGIQVHEFKDDVEKFIDKYRVDIQDMDRTMTAVNCGGSIGVRSALAYHGLRYSFGQKLYAVLRGRGLSDREARKELTIILGHSRIEITYVYVP